MKRISKIISTGLKVPDKILTNQYFNEFFKEDVGAWLESMVGQKERHILGENESVSDLSIEAAFMALNEGGVAPEELNLIIVSSDTHEYISPPTSFVVQGKLGAKNAMNFDLNASCASFVTALSTADRWLKTEVNAKYALVIGQYGMTKYLDWNDKYTATLFADGAGAFLLKGEETDEEAGILGSAFVADGTYFDYIGVFGGGTKHPLNEDTISKGLNKLRILKRYPPDINSKNWPILTRNLMEKIDKNLDDINMIFFTQINLTTIKEVMFNLNIPLEKTHWVMDKYGYTGSACIPMAVHDARVQGKLKKGDLIVLVASGAGYAMGAIALKWSL
ncbi:MAG: 3-oxoacyl-(acyl-carrier-protein) synthase 3 [candidate division WS2 bacterium]|uniref:3-oxoacyl-(Acyl-carrier-protein) synthase 3 n=1 Tax=Psychracetigena formicireducens TaxID=2986056 RepID=A0A9E2F6P8_PSYF1|nr:3-oxoacyl-(acyl-carrier-protein) synthase 3 [Candidatus Psychracetigena formicireducens]MBT9151071.1 3-oxoacyl-(acyl-carrier-protein) synthase 3 [Candidatus Psychracetigena formicireducens]